MEEAPAIFRRNIAEHNRHCWIAAGLSLLGAVLSWFFFGAILGGVVLLVEVVRTGEPGLPAPPRWLVPALAGWAGVIFAWGFLDRYRRRFRPVDDRAIIGWHLIADCMLAPARLTFSVWDQMNSMIFLNRAERNEAWRLLEIIVDQKRPRASTLGQYSREPASLPKLLLALQLTGWIDLHRGQEDWFYTLRSDAEQNYRLLQN